MSRGSSGHSVVFLVFDGMKTLDVVGPAEVFAEANRHGANYRLAYCSPDGLAVRTSISTTFPVDAAAESVQHADTLLVSGGDELVAGPVDPRLRLAVRHLAGQAGRIASICTGAFILADAGLLDGRRATTHWQHASRLAASYPRIDVEPDAIYLRDGVIYTSAGVSAGIDLALALVEQDHGSSMARAVARSLVVYLQRAGNQSQFSAPLNWAAPRGRELRLVVDHVNAHPADDLSLGALAALANLSERHLTRLFHRELAMTPAKYVEAIRFDLAKALLDSGSPVAEAASASGFGSAETLRRIFTARTGIPPSAYRQRFGDR